MFLTVSEWLCSGDKELVHTADMMLLLLLLVLSCEALPVDIPSGEPLKVKEMDQVFALANRDLGFLEFDIVLPQQVSNKKKRDEEAERTRRDLVADSSKLWPGGVVPYVLPSFISESFHTTTASNALAGCRGHCRSLVATLYNSLLS